LFSGLLASPLTRLFGERGKIALKTLVVFYSYSGITRKLAEDIALLTDGELRELKPQKPYSYSYNTAVKEVRGEIERGYCPPLKEGAEPVGDAELIFIGSPNWLHTFAPPVLSFLRAVNLSGKTVIPFCTHGGGGFGDMPERYRKECKGAVLRDGIALKGDYSFDELEAWIRNL
jgi:putative flavodoxin